MKKGDTVYFLYYNPNGILRLLKLKFINFGGRRRHTGGKGYKYIDAKIEKIIYYGKLYLAVDIEKGAETSFSLDSVYTIKELPKYKLIRWLFDVASIER